MSICQDKDANANVEIFIICAMAVGFTENLNKLSLLRFQSEPRTARICGIV